MMDDGRPRPSGTNREETGGTPVLHFDNLRMADKSDRGIYVLGSLLGAGAGFLDVKVGDLLLTALFVLIATMLLGVLRPHRPWRWTLTVAVFVPLAQFAAYAALAEKPYRAQIYESFLGFLTGIAGAYGGATARRGMAILFGK